MNLSDIETKIDEQIKNYEVALSELMQIKESNSGTFKFIVDRSVNERNVIVISCDAKNSKRGELKINNNGTLYSACGSIGIATKNRTVSLCDGQSAKLKTGTYRLIHDGENEWLGIFVEGESDSNGTTRKEQPALTLRDAVI